MCQYDAERGYCPAGEGSVATTIQKSRQSYSIAGSPADVSYHSARHSYTVPNY
jgi:hypothetical protein